MIDVALTGQYDVCLFNSAAQVHVVRSGHSNPSDSLRDFTLGWLEFSLLSAKVFVKRWLKFYNRHLIWLLCVLCLSDYCNKAPPQSIKVHQFISGVILGDVIFASRQIGSSMQVELGGMMVIQVPLVTLQAYFADMCVSLILGILCVWHNLLMYRICVYSESIQL